MAVTYHIHYDQHTQFLKLHQKTYLRLVTFQNFTSMILMIYLYTMHTFISTILMIYLYTMHIYIYIVSDIRNKYSCISL